MKRERTRAVGIGAQLGTTSGFVGLLSDIQSDAYRKLEWLAWLAATVLVFRLVAVVFLGQKLGAFLWLSLAFAPFAVGLAIACRLRKLPRERFAFVAMGFEVLIALALGGQLLDWQNTLGAGGWPLAAIPTVGVWVILFANVIPLPPWQHLLGASIAASAVPLSFFLSLSLYQVPAALGPQDNLRVFLQLMIPTAIAVAIAYVGSRRVYGLSLDLTEARRLGNYQLIEKLGEGGMGEVWKAEHRLLARPAAVKLIRSDVPGSGFEKQLRRFEREIQATVSLDSPHTIDLRLRHGRRRNVLLRNGATRRVRPRGARPRRWPPSRPSGSSTFCDNVVTPSARPTRRGWSFAFVVSSAIRGIVGWKFFSPAKSTPRSVPLTPNRTAPRGETYHPWDHISTPRCRIWSHRRCRTATRELPLQCKLHQDNTLWQIPADRSEWHR